MPSRGNPWAKRSLLVFALMAVGTTAWSLVEEAPVAPALLIGLAPMAVVVGWLALQRTRWLWLDETGAASRYVFVTKRIEWNRTRYYSYGKVSGGRSAPMHPSLTIAGEYAWITIDERFENWRADQDAALDQLHRHRSTLRRDYRPFALADDALVHDTYGPARLAELSASLSDTELTFHKAGERWMRIELSTIADGPLARARPSRRADRARSRREAAAVDRPPAGRDTRDRKIPIAVTGKWP